MNKINNQFTSIEQITDRYLGTGKGNSTVHRDCPLRKF